MEQQEFEAILAAANEGSLADAKEVMRELAGEAGMQDLDGNWKAAMVAWYKAQKLSTAILQHPAYNSEDREAAGHIWSAAFYGTALSLYWMEEYKDAIDYFQILDDSNLTPKFRVLYGLCLRAQGKMILKCSVNPSDSSLRSKQQPITIKNFQMSFIRSGYCSCWQVSC